MTESTSESAPAEREGARILRLFGPPGTGKTTDLADRVKAAVRLRGPDSVLVASFTNTAAAEIGSRGLGLPRTSVGTLHSHAFRIIGSPLVALDPKVIKDWNEQTPRWTITPSGRGQALAAADKAGSASRATSAVDAESGDELLAALDLLRSQGVPKAEWPTNVRAFAARWTGWKREIGAVDFCMDEETEVFTARGWLRGDDVREGDLVRSINPDTGLAEWQPVEGVYRRRGRAQMIHMVNAVHDSLTTPDHRWLVNRRNAREEWSLDWATTETLNSTARIPRAAISGDAATETKFADAFVELVAWWFTEGSYRSGGVRGGQIGQSHRVNPAHCARIEAALRVLGGAPGLRRNGRVVWSISRSEKRGMTFYGIGGELVDELDTVAPDKVPTIEFLAQLTPAQLRLFVDTALDADGHVRAQASTFGQRDARRTEALATAAVLSGMSVTFATPRPMGDGEVHEVTISSRRLHAMVPGTTRAGFNKGTRTPVFYDGLIWCPTVARHHNFLARRNGKTYYTGNTDMTHEALRRARDGEGLPANFVDLVVDESQDCTPMELALAMAWGRLLPEHGHVVFGFDDDQTIAQWRGGDPQPLLDLGPDDCDTIILGQSHRVPPAVHACALQWVERIENRYHKEYTPRKAMPERGDADEADAHGYAYRVGFDLASDDLIRSIERDLDAGIEPMVLASCGYMLNPVISKLRAAGLPFHNPFRKSDGQWNPLGTETGTSTAERVAAYLKLTPESPWTGEDIAKWSELLSLPKAGMIHGARRYIDNLPRGEVPWSLLSALWKPGPLDEATGEILPSEDLVRAVTPDLEWFAERVLGSKAKVAGFPLQIARARGTSALTTGLRAVVGTIHSVKGATATKVYLAPDLSAAGGRQWTSGDPTQTDQVRRLFYVGQTRAFRELVVLAPNSNHHVSPAELVPAELEVRRPGDRSVGQTERSIVRSKLRARTRRPSDSTSSTGAGS